MTADLVTFLRSCIAEDRQVAHGALADEFVTSGRWLPRGPYGEGDRFGNIQSEQNEQIVEESLPWRTVAHVARHDPARALAEAEAKERILDRYVSAVEDSAEDVDGYYDMDRAEDARHLLPVLRLLTLPYRDHPDFRPEWTPEVS